MDSGNGNKARVDRDFINSFSKTEHGGPKLRIKTNVWLHSMLITFLICVLCQVKYFWETLTRQNYYFFCYVHHIHIFIRATCSVLNI